MEPFTHQRQQYDQDAHLRRPDRFNSRGNGGRTGAIMSAPRHLDARLIEDGRALEAAWHGEIGMMIAARRLKTPEAEAAARAARADSASIARRIEMARALTLDGLKVQAQAILWRRDGEPLAMTIGDDPGSDDAWTDMSELPYQ